MKEIVTFLEGCPGDCFLLAGWFGGLAGWLAGWRAGGRAGGRAGWLAETFKKHVNHKISLSWRTHWEANVLKKHVFLLCKK